MKWLKIAWKVVWFLIQAVFVMLIFEKAPYGDEFAAYGLLIVYSSMVIALSGIGIAIKAIIAMQIKIYDKLLKKDDDEKEVVAEQMIEIEKNISNSTKEHYIYGIFWSIVWLAAVFNILGI